MEGYGVYDWVEGKKYEGQWLGGKMHGYGVFSFPDGRCYKGNYVLD